MDFSLGFSLQFWFLGNNSMKEIPPKNTGKWVACTNHKRTKQNRSHISPVRHSGSNSLSLV